MVGSFQETISVKGLTLNINSCCVDTTPTVMSMRQTIDQAEFVVRDRELSYFREYQNREPVHIGLITTPDPV